MTPELEAITLRLDDLEKQVAHLAALVTEQSDKDRTITARGFVVRDTEGKDRATLALYEKGPVLGIFDANGKVGAGLGITTEGPFLELYDANGTMRVQLAVNAGEASSLQIYDANGNKRVRLCLDEREPRRGPWLGFYDAARCLRMDALVTDEYGPRLFLRDKEADVAVQLRQAGFLWAKLLRGQGWTSP